MLMGPQPRTAPASSKPPRHAARRGMQISPLSAQWTVATFSKARRSSAMADREVTSIERLARQMCKLLLHEMSLLAAVLRDRLSEQAQHERHRISGAWRRKS